MDKFANRHIKRLLTKGRLAIRSIKREAKHPKDLLYLPVKAISSLFSLKSLKRISTIIAALFLFVFLSITSVMIITSFFIDEDAINNILIDLVDKQTGGALKIGNSNINLFTGVVFENVKLLPPTIRSNEGDSNPTPILKIDRISLDYSFLSLFIGKIKLNEAIIDAPFINLVKEDNKWNFQPILDHIKSLSSEQETPIIEEPKKEILLSDLIPIDPSYIVIPINISLNQIGFKKLSASITEVKDGIPLSKTNIAGLSTLVSINSFFKKSYIKIFTGSHENSRLTLDITKYKKDKPNNLINASIKLSHLIELNDFNRLSLSIDSVIEKVSSSDITIENIPFSLLLDFGLRPSLDGIDIFPSHIKLGDIYSHKIDGYIFSSDLSLNLFQLNIDQSLRFELTKLNNYLNKLNIPINLSGVFLLNKLNINGPLSINDLPSNLNSKTIPKAKVSINLDNISAKSDKLGLDVSPIQGNLVLDASPSITKKGVQLHTSTNIHIQRASISTPDADNSLKASIENFSTSISANFNYPQMEVPNLQIKTDISNISAINNEQSKVNFPLMLNILGSTKENFKKIDLTTNIEIEDILEISNSLRCKNGCQQFKTKNSVQIENFDKIYSMAKPFLSKFLPLNKIPSYIKGNTNLSLQAKGTIPSHTEFSPDNILKKANIKFRTTFAINNFSTEVPFKGIMLDNFQTKLSLSGNLKKQNIQFQNEFDRFSFLLNEEKTANPISINRFSFSTLLTNEIDNNASINNIIKKISSKVESKLLINQISIKDFYPRPIKGISLSVDAAMNRLKRVDLNQIAVSIPDLGAHLAVNGHTILDPSIFPQSFEIAFNSSVNHLGTEQISSGIKTSGKMNSNIKVFSDDMKYITMNGKTQFEHFHLSIPSSIKSQKALVAVENINGDIPMSQTIDLTKFVDIGSIREGKKYHVPTRSDLNRERKDPIETYYVKSRDTLTKKTNLVSHVDYSNIRDFYPEHKTLSIERLSAANLDFKNMEFDIVLKQNWFSLSNFSIFFLGGKVQGSTQLAFNPMPEALKLSLHVTKLNTHKLIDNFPKLRDKVSSWHLGSDPYIDSSIHLNYDLKNNDMSGGIDITTIGKEQLKMILYYLDPEEKNPTLSSIKKALAIGDINMVSIPIKNGYIGLNVDLSLLSVPMPLPDLDRFPIAQIIDNLKTSNNDNDAEKSSDTSTL